MFEILQLMKVIVCTAQTEQGFIKSETSLLSPTIICDALQSTWSFTYTEGHLDALQAQG